jgi:hypothetical protein
MHTPFASTSYRETAGIRRHRESPACSELRRLLKASLGGHELGRRRLDGRLGGFAQNRVAELG